MQVELYSNYPKLDCKDFLFLKIISISHFTTAIFSTLTLLLCCIFNKYIKFTQNLLITAGK